MSARRLTSSLVGFFVGCQRALIENSKYLRYKKSIMFPSPISPWQTILRRYQFLRQYAVSLVQTLTSTARFLYAGLARCNINFRSFFRHRKKLVYVRLKAAKITRRILQLCSSPLFVAVYFPFLFVFLFLSF